MKKALRAALALLAALACAPVAAQSLAGTPIKAPGGFLPGSAIYCDNGSGAAILCSFSGANPSGLGALAAVPSGSTNGTALGTLPTSATGARFYLGAADSVTFTIAASAPSSAPAVTFTISGASGGTGPNWDENLAGGQMIYITATTGSPKFRWY